MSELRVLALDNNEIKMVPKAIGKLSQLQSLLLRCGWIKNQSLHQRATKTVLYIM